MFELEDIIREVMTDIGRDLIARYQQLGLKASGRWEDEIEIEATPFAGRVTGLDYTEYLDRGRGRNSDQSHEGLAAFATWASTPGQDGGFILEWVRSRGISEELAFPIAYAIARDGWSRNPDGTDLLDSVLTEERIEESYQRIGEPIIASIGGQIVRNFQP